MNGMTHGTMKLFCAALVLTASALLAGCPAPPVPPVDNGEGEGEGETPPEWNQAEYDRGFDEGFLVDEQYWKGFDDSFYTRDAGPIYYAGAGIPYVEAPEYDAGYWDGVWYAYNDGYFVAYDYAFTVGFSEGYDIGYRPDWPDFLHSDQHVEYYDGGFTDGYNDGFSEGRVLGATDYAQGLPYDWLDAMMYYREGNDVYIEELDLGTGEYGPVYLYEYGTDPNELLAGKKSANGAVRDRAGRGTPSIRRGPEKAEAPALSYRALPENVRGLLNTRPTVSPRSTAELTLKDTWLQRIETYRSTIGG